MRLSSLTFSGRLLLPLDLSPPPTPCVKTNCSLSTFCPLMLSDHLCNQPRGLCILYPPRAWGGVSLHARVGLCIPWVTLPVTVPTFVRTSATGPWVPTPRPAREPGSSSQGSGGMEHRHIMNAPGGSKHRQLWGGLGKALLSPPPHPGDVRTDV